VVAEGFLLLLGLLLLFVTVTSNSAEEEFVVFPALEDGGGNLEVESTSQSTTTTKKAKNCTFVCPVNSGNHADPCECRKFYICSTDGSAHRSFCPARLYWDDEKK
jgi:hypothetical protein